MYSQADEGLVAQAYGIFEEGPAMPDTRGTRIKLLSQQALDEGARTEIESLLEAVNMQQMTTEEMAKPAR